MLSFLLAPMRKLKDRFCCWLVAGSATEQRGEKGKLLLCNAFKDCASFKLVQHWKHKLIVSPTYQWAP